ILFKPLRIRTGERESASELAPQPLYRELLGNAWERLPEPIRLMHNNIAGLEAHGNGRVARGERWLARFAATAFGFPEAADSVPVRVSFQSRGHGELWRRTFNQKSFCSFQARGEGRSEGLLCERFGAFSFYMALVVEDEKLAFVVRGWSFLGIPLPLALAPMCNSYEFVQEGRFHFHVELAHALTGLIVRYSGWLIA
ncbi:MAG TPA: DUF4166 domain-containing protein, partial [Usitatibacter sp.]|nr:DUF4166 domain-containing protein [Usitatibacter sp.]